MAIPNAREDPPPPLPPPRYINGLGVGQDPGWKWSNSRHRAELETAYLTSVKPEPYHRCSGEGGDTFDLVKFRRMSSSAPIETDMPSADGLDHSDEERNGLTRPSLAR